MYIFQAHSLTVCVPGSHRWPSVLLSIEVGLGGKEDEGIPAVKPGRLDVLHRGREWGSGLAII